MNTYPTIALASNSHPSYPRHLPNNIPPFTLLAESKTIILVDFKISMNNVEIVHIDDAACDLLGHSNLLSQAMQATRRFEYFKPAS